jgi:hypothetical protein
MVKYSDPGSEIWDKHPCHISGSLVTVFWVNIVKFFVADPGSGAFLTLDPETGMEKNPDPG